MALLFILVGAWIMWVKWITREIPHIDPGSSPAQKMEELKASVGHAEYAAWFKQNFGDMQQPGR